MSWNQNFKECRERYGYGQKEISKILGISERTLQRYEYGESEPTVSMLIKLSNLYGISIDAIVGNDTTSTFDVTKIERYLKDIEKTCNILRQEMYSSEEFSL